MAALFMLKENTIYLFVSGFTIYFPIHKVDLIFTYEERSAMDLQVNAAGNGKAQCSEFCYIRDLAGRI